jgi:hypothetical protein
MDCTVMTYLLAMWAEETLEALSVTPRHEHNIEEMLVVPIALWEVYYDTLIEGTRELDLDDQGHLQSQFENLEYVGHLNYIKTSRLSYQDREKLHRGNGLFEFFNIFKPGAVPIDNPLTMREYVAVMFGPNAITIAPASDPWAIEYGYKGALRPQVIPAMVRNLYEGNDEHTASRRVNYYRISLLFERVVSNIITDETHGDEGALDRLISAEFYLHFFSWFSSGTVPKIEKPFDKLNDLQMFLRRHYSFVLKQNMEGLVDPWVMAYKEAVVSAMKPEPKLAYYDEEDLAGIFGV